MSKAIVRGFLASLVLTVLAALPVRAADADPHAYVVLVGVSEYADQQIKPRPQAEADVKALYDLLTNKDYLGVDAAHVRLLLGNPDPQRKSEPATHENIVKALRWAITQAGRDDLVLFAFIGQGGPLGERTCLFASDSTFKERAKNAVAAAEIEQELEKLKSQRFAVLLDVNFKGFDVGKESISEPNVIGVPQTFGLGHDEENPSIGRVLFSATSGLRQSIDLKDQGLFTKVILEGLKGAADKEGYEPDGLVTVDELQEYLGKEMSRQLREHVKADNERLRVQPYVESGPSSNFILTRNPAVTAKVREQLAKLAQLAQNEKISKEFAEEGHNLLSRMPKLKAHQELRRQYQQLVAGNLAAEEFGPKREKLLAGLKLKRETAQAYAVKVIQATQIIREGFVKEVKQGELVANAIRGLYKSLDERLPADLRERVDKCRNLSETELTRLLADVRERLGQREDLDNHKDLDYSLKRMLSPLDPYTTYIDPDTLQRFQQDTTGRFTGIGIQITTYNEREMLQVITPIRGSPAYREGLKAGDYITKIIREVDSTGKKLNPVEVISTKGLPTSEAVKKILGKPGTKVKLAVDRQGVDRELEFEITRDWIEVESVLGHKRKADDDWDYYVDSENKIAYVRLSGFARNTSRDLARVLVRLKKQGVKGLVLDLRFNPGGLLTSAVEISDMFIDDGVIVSIRPRVGRELTYPGENEGSFLEFPMVCLVNGYSASGSEIVAACLQDHKRALVMGERTYGKGSVQNIQPFEGGELKLTTASFWRPSGKNLNKSSTGGKDEEDWGVLPDKGYALKLSPKEREELIRAQKDSEIIPRRDLPAKETKPEFKDRQLQMALDYLRGQIRTAAKAEYKRAG
jgi:C-terminal peptidase prc